MTTFSLRPFARAVRMFYTIVALIGSLLMDISYGLVDPRVRVDK